MSGLVVGINDTTAIVDGKIGHALNEGIDLAISTDSVLGESGMLTLAGHEFADTEPAL